VANHFVREVGEKCPQAATKQNGKGKLTNPGEEPFATAGDRSAYLIFKQRVQSGGEKGETRSLKVGVSIERQAKGAFPEAAVESRTMGERIKGKG